MFLIRFLWSLIKTRSLIGLGLFLVLWGLLGWSMTPVQASGINKQINYQGKLLDPFGQLVVDGTYQMKFSLYDAVTGGTTLWTASGTPPLPTAIPVSVADGLFTVMLGDTSNTGGWQNELSNIDWNVDALYLGVTVSPDVGEMTPRKRLGAVPQAFNSEQLQGMYASSSLVTTGAMFVINQADGTAAGATRTALEVRNQGTSLANDYSIRALDSSGSAVYTLNSAGHATGTSYSLTKNGQFRALIDSNVALAISTTTSIGTLNGVSAFQVQGKYGYVLSGDRNFDIVDLSGMTGVGSVGQLASPFMSKLVVGGNYVYGAASSRIYVIDVSRPAQPVIVSSPDFSEGETISFLSLQGNRLYVGYGVNMKVLDISNPRSLRVLGTFSSLAKATGGAVQGRYAYITDFDDGLIRVVDVADPTNMFLVSDYTITNAGNVVIEGGRLLVMTTAASVTTINLLDATDPMSLAPLGTYASGRLIFAPPVMRGRYIYISAYNSGTSAYEAYIVDAGNPSNLTAVQSFIPSGGGGAVDVSGNEFFVPTGSGISVYPLASAELAGIRAHAVETGNLDVKNTAVFSGQGFFLRGASVIGGLISDGMSVAASSTSATVQITNTLATTTNTAWGAYINNLLVGGSVNATGSTNYRMVLGYNEQGSPATTMGICIDDLSTAKTCPSSAVSSASIVAEGSVTGGAYDLAERYQISGEVEPGDLVSFDPTTPLHAIRSPGVAYDQKLMGIVSTAPGFILGLDGGKEIALAGRVPTKFSAINGEISIGDPLTSSIYPGVAMKATQPGRVIGYALEATSTTSTIEVFVKVGYEAGALLANNGREATLNGNLAITARETATAASRLSDSWGLTFRGSAWDGSQALEQDYLLSTNVFSATSSQWSINKASSTLFAIDQDGNARIQGDFFLGGRLYPSAQGTMQNSKYIFLDDRDASTTYMATNADGWQANDSYDFAERYYSPDALTPGDVVVVSQQGRLHVQRSSNTALIPMGIVSTRPAFVAGAPASSTYPIALAGRVPTKVSTSNGVILIGDLLAPSTIPGVAIKATKAGPVVGQALEGYSESGVGSIEVFVRTGWWGGSEKDKPAPTMTESADSSPLEEVKVYQGLARVTTGGQKVHVKFPSVGSYPLVQITPYGEVSGGWWTDGYSHEGFDIILKQKQLHEVTFSWRVEGMTMEQSRVPLSDGTIRDVDIDTGSLIPTDPEEEPVVVAPAPPIPEAIIIDPEPVPTPASVTEEEPAVSPIPVVPAVESEDESVETPTPSTSETEPVVITPPVVTEIPAAASTEAGSSELPESTPVSSAPVEEVSAPASP
jgi:hypothetical protein